MTEIRVALPVHLQTLARVQGEVRVRLEGAPTIGGVLDRLEEEYPMLRGTIREHGSRKRRAFLRFFAAGADMSHESQETLLPDSVVAGSEIFSVVGAIAGG